MHFWPNPSVLKSHSLMSKFKSQRPKGIKDEEWLAMIAEHRFNKQVLLNKVPKASKKEFVKKDK